MLARGIVLLAILAAAFLVSCGQATPSAPASSASPSGAAPSTQPASSPAASQAAKPAASPDWKVEWDKTVAAAKQEGRVVVKGAVGTWGAAAAEFKKAYPEITLEFTGGLGRDVNPKILAERGAGQYLWDVYTSGAADLHGLTAHNVWAPLRPALILPEVLDDSKWRDGLNEGFLDKAGQYIYLAHLYVSPSVYVNRQVVPESELKTLDDLLDPKWKGKIAWQDPRVPGAGQSRASNFLAAKGEDFLRKLLSQDIVALTDTRMLVENLVRGAHPIAIGTRPDERDEFTKAGLFGHVKEFDPDNPAALAATGASGVIALVDKAPHPNAAKVFINWYLSREGQRIHVEHTATNSRRLDVDGPPETAPKPGVKYANLDKEENLHFRDRTVQIAKEILK